MSTAHEKWTQLPYGGGYSSDAVPPKILPIPEPMDADGGDKNALPDESLSVGPISVLLSTLMDTVFRFKEPEEKSLLKQLCDALRKEDENIRLDVAELVDMFYELEEGTDDVANVVAQFEKRREQVSAPPPAAPTAEPLMDIDAQPPEPPEKKKEKKKDLKPELTCKVCLDNQVAVTFVPCGHLVTCVTCTAALFECPVCRAHIRGTIRTYV